MFIVKTLLPTIITGKITKDYCYVCIKHMSKLNNFLHDLDYFSGMCNISQLGIESMDIINMQTITDNEKVRLDVAIDKIKLDIERAYSYSKNSQKKL